MAAAAPQVPVAVEPAPKLAFTAEIYARRWAEARDNGHRFIQAAVERGINQASHVFSLYINAEVRPHVAKIREILSLPANNWRIIDEANECISFSFAHMPIARDNAAQVMNGEQALRRWNDTMRAHRAIQAAFEVGLNAQRRPFVVRAQDDVSRLLHRGLLLKLGFRVVSQDAVHHEILFDFADEPGQASVGAAVPAAAAVKSNASDDVINLDEDVVPPVVAVRPVPAAAQPIARAPPAAAAAASNGAPEAKKARVDAPAADEEQCAVCMERPCEVYLLPCNHRDLCVACVGSLPTRECPTCRRAIVAHGKIRKYVIGARDAV